MSSSSDPSPILQGDKSIYLIPGPGDRFCWRRVRNRLHKKTERCAVFLPTLIPTHEHIQHSVSLSYILRAITWIISLNTHNLVKVIAHLSKFEPIVIIIFFHMAQLFSDVSDVLVVCDADDVFVDTTDRCVASRPALRRKFACEGVIGPNLRREELWPAGPVLLVRFTGVFCQPHPSGDC